MQAPGSEEAAPPTSAGARSWWLVAGATAMALAVVAPLLRPGAVLLQDMVFVPRQPWSPQWLGLSSALPRSVPVDAVVSALTAVVPGSVLQRAVLLLALALAALGAARLVPAGGLPGRAAAGLAYAWTPYVAERLLMGQWTLVVAHAALPWVVAGALAVRRGEQGAVARTLLPVAVSSLTPTGGLLALAATGACAGRSRAAALAGAGAVVLQLPWLVPSVLHPAGSVSDPDGVAAFAARGESWAGVVGALAGTGGIWNGAAVPGSRTTAVAPLLTLAVLGVAAAGLPLLRRRWGRAAAARLAALGVAALVLAAVGALPGTAGLLRAAVEQLPGAGLLRDGQKWLPPWALLVALCFGLGVERLAAAPARRGLAALALLLPLAALPDLAWGVGGRLETATWPRDWERVRSALAEDDDHPGAVVSLPFTAYRAYDWNGRRPSLDPAPRWLGGDVLVDDRLAVGSVVLDGEDPRSARVRQALDDGTPLGEQGVGWLLVQRGTPGEVPAPALRGAEPVVVGDDLELWRVREVDRDVDRASADLPPRAPVLAGHAAAALVVLASVGAAVTRGRRPAHD